MKRNVLLLAALVVLGTVAALALKGANAAAGSKEQAAKEKSLSVTVSAAPIDQHQPQHLKTATFALG